MFPTLFRLPAVARRSLLVTVVVCVFLITPSLGQDPLADSAARPVANENYKIGPGDVIDVIVSKNDVLSRTGLRVTNQGTIQLAMMDSDVQAACLTERQLADVIKERYLKYLVNPYINVAVREFNSSPVAVIGAVNSPGRFQLQRTARLSELLTLANGPAEKAGRTVEIIRNSGRPYCEDTKLIVPAEAGDEILSLAINDTFKGGDQTNPIVHSGDIIRVAEADEVNAYIQGNVKSSIALNLKDPVTLSQAIAMAGGTTPGAELEKIKIRRQIAGSINRNEIIVNLKAINQQKRDDVLLEPNDIIEVPGPSGSKKLFQNIIRSVIPGIARLPVSVVGY